MTANQIAPSLGALSFNCPHCRAIAHQSWYRCVADPCKKDEPPALVREADIEERLKIIPDPEMKERVKKHLKKLASGSPYLYYSKDGVYGNYHLQNVIVSRCYSCDRDALWIYDRLV